MSQETVTHQRVEDADQFGEGFERVLDRLKCRRLVIAFDDLDRCSPDKVTEMLATIKTFLEPKSDDREVVFVIAAAEDELRRHLIAQELAAGGGGTDRVDDDIPEVIRQAVDEYLRKFFNAKVRLPDALDDDIREFARSQLAVFVEQRQISDEQTADLGSDG